MDPLWIGAITTGFGALAGSAAPAALQAWIAHGQRKLDASEARREREAKATEAKLEREAEANEKKAQREFDEKARRRQFAAELLPERRERIAHWKEQLFAAGKENREYLGPDTARRNVVGERWFEELCTHLTGEVAEDYRDVSIVHIHGGALSELTAEIARIEREWIAEAQG